jgi:hypothetical protein
VLIRVISQIKTINARPIPQSSRVLNQTTPQTLGKQFSHSPFLILEVQATVGGECTTGAREKTKASLRKNRARTPATDHTDFHGSNNQAART